MCEYRYFVSFTKILQSLTHLWRMEEELTRNIAIIATKTEDVQERLNRAVSRPVSTDNMHP